MSNNNSPYKPTGFSNFGEDTVLGLSVKSLIAIGITLATMVSMYMTLQADIQVAMEEPKAPITKKEYELQTKIMDKAIIETKEDISEIKKSIEKMEDRLFNSRGKYEIGVPYLEFL